MHGAGRARGCSLIFPDISHEPVVHNPFPQLNKVAIAPFFNQSNEPTVDGRKFALAYFAELQAVPGFEVVPLGVVETAIIENQVNSRESGRSPAAGQYFGCRCRRRRLGYRLHAVLSAALRPASRMVRGKLWLPRNSAGIRPAVGHARRRIHSRAARVRVRVRTRQSAAQNANADFAKSRRSIRRVQRQKVSKPIPALMPSGPPLPPPGESRPDKATAKTLPNAPASSAPSSKSAAKKKADRENAQRHSRACYEQKLPAKNCQRATAPEMACPHR